MSGTSKPRRGNGHARPGPWSFEPEYISAERKLTTGKFIIRDAQQKFVCEVEGETNARLIAAASKTMKQEKRPEGDYRYPEAPIATYPPTERHPEGRAARVFDIVETEIAVGSYSRIPVIAQIFRVLPLAAKAEIALISRPSGTARRLPHMALQNLAARILERDLQPLEKLRLRSRATRPVASYLRAALSGSKPG